MSRRKETRAEKVERMRALVFDAETSGLSLAEFARQEGIAEQTLYWWRKRLRGEHDPEPRALIPVEVRGASPSLGLPSPQLEIAIGDDLELRLPVDTDVTVIADLISALRSC